ncbi:MAG: FlgD immunoglobulin-like domain containing protein [Candidatus Tenebribacter burtonii]|nr:FlgD immunoglobulin-like domain containing protein [Candidatus Tenebribacter burtonii]
MKPRIVLIIFSLLIINSSLLIAQPGWIQNYEPFQRPLFSYSYKTGNIQVTDDDCFVVNGTCTESDDDIGWYSKFGFFIKFDPEGNIIWASKDSLNSAPPMWDCESETFAILPDGGFVSAGCVGLINPDYLVFRSSEGNLENIIYYNDMNYKSMCVVDDGTALLFAGSSGGATLQKTDLLGNEIWRQNYYEYNSTSIVSVVQTNDGGYAFLSFTLSDFDYCLVKTDASGLVEWSQTYDYNSQNEIPNSMIQTSDNGYLLCGHTDDPDRGGFIVKTDALGDTLWTRKYELSYCARIWCATSTNNEIVLHGYSNNGIIILFKIDNFGNEIWYEGIPGIAYTNAEQNMQVCDSGFIIYLQGDIIDDDILLIKTDENGNVSVEEEIIILSNNLQCYPNPFNPTTKISFSIPDDSKVKLTIYNIKGQKIKSLLNDQMTAGEHSIVWNGEDDSGTKVSSGVYLYKLHVNGKTELVKRCLLLK